MERTDVSGDDETVDATISAGDGPPLVAKVARERVRGALFGESTHAPEVGRFKILQCVGTGGMGVVYAAYDPQLDRRVAVKLLHATASEAHVARRRVLAEARAMAKVSHPNVVPVFEAGELDKQVFIAMEFIDGGTVRQWLETKRRWHEIVQVFIAAGRGLSAAHQAGLVHRDFKPENVMLRNDGHVLVTDFGVARGFEPQRDEELATTAPDDESGDVRRTLTAGVAGTPAYIAPEVYAGQRADVRSDQFSFCVALFECLFGTRPFAGTGLIELATSIIEGNLVEVDRGDVPARVQRAVQRGLASDPDQRWPSVDALLEELRRSLPRRRSRAWLAVGAVATLGTVAVGVAARDDPPCARASAGVVGLWNPERRAELAERFAAVDQSAQANRWAAVVGAVDAFAARLGTGYERACAATHVEGTQSEARLGIRRRCLDRRAREFGAVLEQLGEADALIVDRALTAVEGLTDPGRCADEDFLLSVVEPPGNVATAAEVARIENELARVAALEAVGKYADAASLAQQVRTSAAEVDYAPIRVDALLLLAEVKTNLDEHDVAEEALEEVLFLAEEIDHPVAAAASARSLAHLHATRGSTEIARIWLRLAAALEIRTGEGPLVKVGTRLERGHILAMEGKPHEALELFREALPVVESQCTDCPELDQARLQIATALNRGGRYREALDYYVRSREFRIRKFGADNVLVADVLHDMAYAKNGLGKYLEAKELLDEAAAIHERVLGPDHVDLAYDLHFRAESHRELGEIAAAAADLDRAAAIYEKTFGPASIDLASVLNDRGAIHRMTKQYDDARRVYKRALSVIADVAGPDHANTAEILNNLANVFIETHQYDEAETAIRRALRITQAAGNPDDPTLANLQYELAIVMSRRSRDREALPLLQEAVANYRRRDDRSTGGAWITFTLAKTVWTVEKDRDRARKLGFDARRTYEAAQGDHARQIGDIDRWLDGLAAPDGQ